MTKKHGRKDLQEQKYRAGNGEDKEQEVTRAVVESGDLAAQLEQKEKEAKENYDKYLRAVADLENYKKRAARERADYLKFCNEGILKEVLPIVDNMERAISHGERSSDFAAFLEGLKLIHGQFLEFLNRNNVVPIEAVGNEFDPNLEEAVMQVQTDEVPDMHVVEEFEKGYILNGRLLRPAKVSVAKNTTEPE